jgi:hypothetical protein
VSDQHATGQQATGQEPSRRRGRAIGGIGTAARLLVGLVLLGSVLQGELAGLFRPAAWAFGLVGLPAGLSPPWSASCAADNGDPEGTLVDRRRAVDLDQDIGPVYSSAFLPPGMGPPAGM